MWRKKSFLNRVYNLYTIKSLRVSTRCITLLVKLKLWGIYLSVSINNLEIEVDFIKKFDPYVNGLILSGTGFGEEGKRLLDALKKYKKGDVVTLTDYIHGFHSGAWEIAQIDLSINDQTSPAEFHFGIRFNHYKTVN